MHPNAAKEARRRTIHVRITDSLLNTVFSHISDDMFAGSGKFDAFSV